MTEGVVKIRLRVETTGGSMGDLLTSLGNQARQFFGDEPYTIDGPVEVDTEEQVRDVGGKTAVLSWRGVATYVTAG